MGWWDVAQQVRAAGLYPAGRAFEPRRPDLWLLENCLVTEDLTDYTYEFTCGVESGLDAMEQRGQLDVMVRAGSEVIMDIVIAMAPPHMRHVREWIKANREHCQRIVTERLASRV